MSELTQKDLILKASYQKKIKEKQTPTKEEREANNKYNRWYRKSNGYRHEATINHSEKWKRENPERVKKKKVEWANNNKDKTKKAVQKWLKKNPNYHAAYQQRRKLEKAALKV